MLIVLDEDTSLIIEIWVWGIDGGGTWLALLILFIIFDHLV